MPYYKQMIVLLLLVQMLSSSWARSRYAPDTWSIPVAYSNDVEDINNDNSYNSNINDNDLLEKSFRTIYKAKKSLRQASHFDNDERKKKYAADLPNIHDGHNLQGLWFIPGRR